MKLIKELTINSFSKHIYSELIQICYNDVLGFVKLLEETTPVSNMYQQF